MARSVVDTRTDAVENSLHISFLVVQLAGVTADHLLPTAPWLRVRRRGGRCRLPLEVFDYERQGDQRWVSW